MFFRSSLAVVALVAAASAPHAFADGDPASDYLISQQMFLPLNANVSTSTAGDIARLLADSKQKGFPLKVAVIAGRYDLGSVPSLFGKPQQYASFLGQEDYYFFKSELLVVMPNGYGLYKYKGLPSADTAAIKKLPAPGTDKGDPLVAAAIHAVRVLAARHGLTLVEVGSGSSSRTRDDRIEIIAGVLALGALALGVRLFVRRRERTS